MKFIRTSLLGLLVLPLAAQSTDGISVGAGMIWGPKSMFGSYSKAVNNTQGVNINAGWDTHVYQTDVAARLGLGIGFMPGERNAAGLKTSLRQYQATGDILFETGAQNLRGVVGLSLNVYSMKKSGTPGPRYVLDANNKYVDHYLADNQFPISDAQGLKLGFRIGLEYTIDKNWGAQFLIQQTELSGRPASEDNISPYDRTYRNGAINPSWMEFSVRYRF